MNNQNKIEIQVTAKDLASDILKQVKGDVSSLGGQAQQSFGSALDSTMQMITGFTLGGLAVNAITSAFNTMKSAVSDAVGWLKESVVAGANLERLKIVTEQLGKNVGYSTTQIDKMVESLNDTNTYGTNAYNSINSLMRSGLMPMIETLESTDVATGKTLKGFDSFIMTIKDLAAASPTLMSSGDAIDTVTRALITQRDEALQTLGINGNMTKGFIEYGKTVGKSAMELSNAERSQVIWNMVAQQGVKVAGSYKKAYETGGKALVSFQDATKSLKEETGLLLQDAFKPFIFDMLELVKAFRTFVMEDPQFKAMMNDVSALFLVAWNLVKEFGRAVLDIWNEISPYLYQIWDLWKQIFAEFQAAAGDDLIRSALQGLKEVFTAELKEFVKQIVDNLVMFLKFLKTPEGKQAMADFKTFIAAVAEFLRLAAIDAGKLWDNISKIFGLDLGKKNKELLNFFQGGGISNLVGYVTGKVGASLGNMISSKAEGGDFIATRPQLLMVGDNPNQRERVTVTPLENGKSAPGGSTLNNTFNISGNNPLQIAQEVGRILARQNQSANLGLNFRYS